MHPEEIKAALRMKGVTLASLADELGVSRSLVSHVIAGKAQSNRAASRIAAVIGKPIAAIWAPKPQRPRLRRTREEIAAQRAAVLAA